jgi:hypothetical protein
MRNELVVSENEQYDNLADELLAIRSNLMDHLGEARVIYKYQIGKAIIDSPLYAKFGKGAEVMKEKLAEHLGPGWSVRSLHECIAFCTELQKRYPKIEAKKAIEKVVGDIGSWTSIGREWGIISDPRRDLQGSGDELCKHVCKYHEKVESER